MAWSSAQSMNRSVRQLVSRSFGLILKAPRRHFSSFSTRNEHEISKFTGIDWENSSGRALASMHGSRMSALTNFLASHSQFGNDCQISPMLKGKRILDVGCGSGLVSRSLASLGADIVAIDVVQDNVDYTQSLVMPLLSEKTTPGSFKGICCSVEELLANEGERSFDLVISFEVIEHVNNQDLFLDTLCKLSDAAVAVSTINRTVKSFALAIVAAEYITGMVPRGTHDWFKFVQPKEMEHTLWKNGLHCERLVGMIYNPLNGSWRCEEGNADVNYILLSSR